MKTILLFFLVALAVTSCTKDAVIENKRSNNLASKVDYGDKITNVVVFESHYKMIVFAMKKGQNLKPHSAPMDAPLVILEGNAKVTIGDEETILKKGDIITLPKEINHGVKPITDCKFLLLK